MPLTDTPRPMRRGPLLLALVAILGLIVPAGAFAAKPGTPAIDIQILNTSDWHGQIDPLPPGGAWSIGPRWAEERTVRPTLTVAAGDDFGATPPLSSFFDEVPSVLAQRLMGVQVGTFGNHNFDRGIAHLQQMIDLAAAPTDADHPGTPYQYVVANLANIEANLTGVEPFAMLNVGGAKVAVIGIINEEAPGLVIPGAFGTTFPTDGVAAANKWAAKARKAGANAVVVITHKGVRGQDIDGNWFGELVDFAEDVDSSLIDVIIGDHTDIKFDGVIDGILVHENRSKGATYTRTVMNVNPGKGGGVNSKSVTYVTPTAPARTSAQLVAAECPDPTGPAPAMYCDEAILEMLVPYRQELAVLLDPKIATATATFVRGGNIERRQEVAIGNLVAEGMKWYQETDFAIVNGGGLRSSLPSSYTPLDASIDRSFVDGDPVDLVLGDVYSVLPFTNTVLRRTITGEQLWEALENGVSRFLADGTNADGRFAQVAGLEYSFNYDLPSGCTGNPLGGPTWQCVPSRVTSVTWPDGTPIPADGTVYTIALPSFNNAGGDAYQVFVDNPQTGENEALDAAVMADYIEFLGNGGFAELDPVEWVDGRILKCGVNHPCGG